RRDRKPERLGRFPDGGLADPLTAPLGPVAAGDDEERSTAVTREPLERRNGEGGRPVVDEAHGARQSDGAASAWSLPGAWNRFSLPSTSFRWMALRRSTKRIPSR